MRAGWVWAAIFCMLAMPGRFIPVYLEQFKLSESQLGIIFSTSFLFASVANAVFCNIADRSNKHVLFYATLPILWVIPFLMQMIALPQLNLIAENMVFPFILVTCVILFVFRASMWSLLTSVTITQLKYKYGDDGHTRFGEERLWGAVSWAICAVILGAVLDIPNVSVWPIYVGFVIATIAHTCTIYLFYKRNNGANGNIWPSDHIDTISDEENESKRLEENTNKPKQPTDNEGILNQSTFEQIYQLTIGEGIVTVLFLNLAFWLGVGMSLVEYFLFLFLQNDLHASNFICGLSVVVTVIFEIPIFAKAPQLLKRIGSTWLAVIAALGFVIRAFGYSVAPSGVFVLLVEPFHGVTFGAFKVASVAYMAERAPKELEATAQSIFQVIDTIATSLGLCLGGYVMQQFGSKILYTSAGVIVLMATVAFALADRFSSTTVKVNDKSTHNSVVGKIRDVDEDVNLMGEDVIDG